MITVLTIDGILTILVGILILMFPEILNYAIGVYLIIVGVLHFLQ